MRRASLSRERERETVRGRESKIAEVGHEPRSSGLRLPKYWDYKRAPPRPAGGAFLTKGNIVKLK